MCDLRFTQEGIREGKPWWVTETPHYVILFDQAARKHLNQSAFARQAEKRVQEIASLLHVRRERRTNRYPIGDKVPYFVHDRAVCTHGNVDVGGIDVPCSGRSWFYRHEESHAILNRLVGSVPSFFNEGFATYASSPRSSRSHRIALAALRAAVLPPLSAIAHSAGFWEHWRICKPFMYDQAGSFVKYLFDRFGARRFTALAGELSFDEKQKAVSEAFEHSYPVGLGEAERNWRSYLLGGRSRLRLSSHVVRGRAPDTRWVKESIEKIRSRNKGRTRCSGGMTAHPANDSRRTTKR